MSKKDRNSEKRLAKQQKAEQQRRRQKRLPMIFGAVLLGIAVLGGAVMLNNSYNSTQQEMEDLYKNKISVSQLEEKIANKEDVYAYFYQPDCEHCKVVSPMLFPMAESMNKMIYPVNVKGIDKAWEDYKLEGTPTLIHFQEGKEVAKIVGSQPQENFREFLSK